MRGQGRCASSARWSGPGWSGLGRRGLLLGLACLACPSTADLYADLGVSRRATAEEIKAAYRARALASHPDKARLGEEEAATEAFTKIASAYETLSDPEKRRQYDAYGPNYARRGGSAAGPRDPFAEFFANNARGGRGGGVARPPSFSTTIELDNENWDHLVGVRECGEVRLWLVLFYAESSEQSRRFNREWELLAERLQPMVRLGRVNTESRNTWLVVRRYRTLLTRLPTLVMVGDEGGDAARATAYYGHSLSADVVGEWARRFYATANTVRVTSARALSEFIRRHAREAGEQPVGLHEGRVPVLLLTAQAAHDTLLLRYLAHRFVNIGADGGVVGGNGGARLALAHCHVLGPLSGASAGALIAQALGVTELPALAIWRDGVARPPEVHRLGGGGGARSAPEADADAAAKGLPGEVAQRVRVVRLLERRGRPRLPKLRASNVQRLCTHPARQAKIDGRSGGCALVLCGQSTSRCAAALALARDAEALLRSGALPAEPRVSWAFVDSSRQAELARVLVDRTPRAEKGKPQPAPLPPDALPAIALLLPATDGLGTVRWALYAAPLPMSSGARLSGGRAEPAHSEAQAAALEEWVEAVLGGQVRTGKAAELPPLLAEHAPGLPAVLWSLLVGPGIPLSQKVAWGVGLLLVLLAIGLVVVLQNAPKPASSGRARGRGESPRAAGAAGGSNARVDSGSAGAGSASASAGAGGGGGARASPGAGGESGGGAASSFDAPPPTVVADNVQSALGAAPFCVLLPHGSAAYASSGCSATARVLRARYASEGSQTFYFATLDIHQDDGGSVVLRHIQLVLRQCGCVALRRSSDIERTRAAVYTGPMSPEALSSWLDRLIGGEIPLAYLVQSG